MAPTEQVKSFGLDMRRAIGWAELKDRRVECFFSATQPVALVKIPGSMPQFDLVANTAVKELGYEPAMVERNGNSIHVTQHAALGFDYVIQVQWKATPDGTLLAVALTTNREQKDPLAFGASALHAYWNRAGRRFGNRMHDGGATSGLLRP